MKKYEKGNKRFLTMQPDQGGSVCWDVAAHQSRRSGRTNISAGIDITDCSRKIGLEFYSNCPSEYKQRLDKLDNFIESLTLFRDALVEARQVNVEHILKYRKDNKGNRWKKDKEDGTVDELTTALEED